MMNPKKMIEGVLGKTAEDLKTVLESLHGLIEIQTREQIKFVEWKMKGNTLTQKEITQKIKEYEKQVL